MDRKFVKRVERCMQENQFIHTFLVAEGGEILERLKSERGYSLRGIARECECSTTFLSDVQNGKRVMSKAIYLKVASLERRAATCLY